MRGFIASTTALGRVAGAEHVGGGGAAGGGAGYPNSGRLRRGSDAGLAWNAVALVP